MKKLGVLLLLAASAVFAGPFSYIVNVNTSGLGASGFLDLTFNKGNVTALDALAKVTGFSGGTVSGLPLTLGDVSGALPGTLNIANTGSPANDYFQAVTLGGTLQFLLTFSGPATTATAPTGSTFGIGLYADAQGTPLVTVDGVVGTIELGGNGSTQGTPLDQRVSITAVPEPSTMTFFAVGAVGLLLAARRRS